MALTPYDPVAPDNSAANSYVDRASAIAFAGVRGVVLANDETTDAALFKAMDYLEAQFERYKGKMADDEQPLQWPRKCVFLYTSCTAFDETLIPQQLKNAQCELAVIIAGGTSLYPVGSGPFVVSEKVDVIETKYSERISTSGLPLIPSVDALLAPLFNGGGFVVQTVRA